MIEAVNSVIANASLVRGNTDQNSSARSFAANPDRVQEAASSGGALPQAPFISPFIFLDVNFDTAVLQIRDPQTGDVVEQIPSRSRLESQQRAAQQADIQAQQTVQSAPDTTQAVQAQAVAQAFTASAQAAESVVSSSVSVFA